MRVIVTGGTGFVGRPLVQALLARGDRVTVLGRHAGDPRVPRGAESAAWTAREGGAWEALVDGADAVLHMAGEPLFGERWSEEKKRRIVASRVESTEAVVRAIERAASRPKVLVSASAVGFYGARAPSEELDETSAPGDGFLASVVKRWEAAADPATALGVRVVKLRTGVVLGAGGGALAQMVTPFRMFAGGPLGDGHQVLSWIHLDDIVGLALLSLDDARAAGPINGTAPNPVDMNELARELGRALHKPSLFRVPGVVLRVALGEAADAVLTGQRALPREALRLGYEFRFPTLRGALANLL
jgi:uncharacterized protein (TIGR01777 family)